MINLKPTASPDGQLAAPGFESPPGTRSMAELIAAKDWSRTPLGPMQSWSPSLRMMTRFLLANRFPLLLWWGPDHISIYNDAYIPVLGRKHPEALGLPVRECWSEIWHVLRPLIETPFRGGPSTWSEDLELEIQRLGFREETHFTVAYSPVPDETTASGIGGVLATVHEITAQVIGERRVRVLSDLGARSAEAKTAEEACRIAAESLARHPKDVPFAFMYLLDKDGREARLAAAAGIEMGGAAADPAAWPIAAVVSTETAQRVDALGSLFGASPGLPQSALVLPVPSNLAHHLAGVLVAGVSPHQELDGLYRGFFDLITAQLATAIANARAYEEERRRAQVLAELDQAKTVFFSNVSHEFRTPLTLMLGTVDDGLEDQADPLTPKQRERQLAVQRNGARLLKLVNSLLDFSRIEAGRIQASYEPVDVGTMTAEIASTFRSLVERAGLRLSLECAPSPEPVFVDREMWEKIVLNLVSNAFKFTFDGEITVRVESDAEWLRLMVRDTGTGIDAQSLPHIFERFHRVEGARGRTYEGTGIGLALVRELAKLHGGTATVESESAKGSCFTVSIRTGTAHLPRERIRAPRNSSSPTVRALSFVDEASGWLSETTLPEDEVTADGYGTPAVESPDAHAASTQILVADDNADMRSYLERLLRPLGRVTTVADGVQALDAIHRRAPDLVVSDVMMPNLDGFGLLRAVRSDERTRVLPIVLLSARAGEEARVEGIGASADDYIVKPFSARELVVRVRAQLELARLRRQHGEALRLGEERFRALVTASSDVVYRMSPDWTEMRYLVGRDFIADTGRPNRSWLQKYIPPEDQPQVLAKIQEAIRTQSLFELEHRVLRRDGTLGWMFSRAVPLKDQSGEILEWFGAATDITCRKLGEEALRNANRELAEVDRRKNDFLAVLSHELRNPLAPIQNSVYLLERAPPGSDQTTRAREVLKRQTAHLTRLVDDLLDVTRISHGKVTLKSTRLDLRDVVRKTTDDLRSLFMENRVELRVEQPVGSILVDGDATRLAQVLGNLLQNAVKFTPRGGSVSVHLGRADGRAILSVRDTGVGMDPAQVERMFQPFAQGAQGSARSQGGLGLGLALVKGFVELHGGSVSARSSGPGQGSEFVVTLPLLEQAPEQELPSAAPTATSRLVLIIEDNLDGGDTLAQALELSGHRAHVARDGRSGLALAREIRPDVIFCDIGLPDIDGFEVARAIRREAALSGVRLIALTGYAQSEDLTHATEAGFDSHIAKPADLDKVYRLLC
jgi:signal transduction histidine kinase